MHRAQQIRSCCDPLAHEFTSGQRIAGNFHPSTIGLETEATPYQTKPGAWDWWDNMRSGEPDRAKRTRPMLDWPQENSSRRAFLDLTRTEISLLPTTHDKYYPKNGTNRHMGFIPHCAKCKQDDPEILDTFFYHKKHPDYDVSSITWWHSPQRLRQGD